MGLLSPRYSLETPFFSLQFEELPEPLSSKSKDESQMKTNLPEETKYTVGIDFSQEKLDVYDEKNGSRCLPNTLAKIEAWLGSLQKVQTETRLHLICEPSGGYEKTVVEAALKAGIDISVVNARQVRDFARAQGKLAKTERD